MAGKKYRSGMLAGAGVVAMAAMSAGHQASAATLFTSNGFETSGGYSTTGGTLSGVVGQGYLYTQPTTGAAFSVPQAIGTAAVNTTLGYGTAGSFAVDQYSGATSSNAQFVAAYGSLPANTAVYTSPGLSSIAPVSLGTPIVDVIATIAVVTPGTGDVAFGLTALDGTANQGVVGDVQVDATTGAVSVNGGATMTGFTQQLSPATFDAYELQLNYATDKYNVYEAPAGASTFTNEIAANIPFETAGETTFSTAALDVETLAGTAGTGTAAFDNFSITSAAVPEPTTASLVVGGLLAVGARRRRRTTAR